MKVLIFGATGMVGQGVLRECLLDSGIDFVQTVGRQATGVPHAKLREVVHADLWNYRAIENDLTGFDACYFCLGVSSGGMSEKDYTHITYDLTLAAAAAICRLSPKSVFVYVSGSGTDSSEKGRVMWARVKGRTENALLRLPFRDAYMFRPGAIIAKNGEVSKTPAYRWLYPVLGPLLPPLRRLFPNAVTSTDCMGRAMIAVTRRGYAKKVLESGEINQVGAPKP